MSGGWGWTVWTPEQIAEIVQLFASGMTQTAIAAHTGRTLKAVNAKLKRIGVDTKSKCRKGHPWATNEAFTPHGVRYCRTCHPECKDANDTPMCRNGHVLSDDNIYIQDGMRRCRICRKEGSARWRARQSPEYREMRNATRRTGKSRSKWQTEETLSLARALWAQGASGPEIAAQIGNGCTYRAIHHLSSAQQWPRAPRIVWDTAKARQLWDEGLGDKRIARQLGTTPGAISGYRRRNKWPLRHVAHGAWRPSAAQEAKVRELWVQQRVALDFILRVVNAAGPKQYTTKKLRNLALRLGLKRPPMPPKVRIRAVAPAKPKPLKPAGGPISIPLREVYQRAAELDLPPSKRGDISALNAAIKRAQPQHPGFRIADHQPTRLTWTS